LVTRVIFLAGVVVQQLERPQIEDAVADVQQVGIGVKIRDARDQPPLASTELQRRLDPADALAGARPLADSGGDAAQTLPLPIVVLARRQIRDQRRLAVDGAHHVAGFAHLLAGKGTLPAPTVPSHPADAVDVQQSSARAVRQALGVPEVGGLPDPRQRLVGGLRACRRGGTHRRESSPSM
jgi:hypothetical protein